MQGVFEVKSILFVPSWLLGEFFYDDCIALAKVRQNVGKLGLYILILCTNFFLTYSRAYVHYPSFANKGYFAHVVKVSSPKRNKKMWRGVLFQPLRSKWF